MPNSLLVDDLRHRLNRPALWAERFRRLAEDVASVPLTTCALPCEDCGDLLDRLVDDKFQSRPPGARAERLMEHRQPCTACRDSCYLLYTARAFTQSVLPLSVNDPSWALSFLRPPRKSDMWRVRVRSRLANPAWGLNLSIQISCLRAALASIPCVNAIRAGESRLPESSHLLVSESVIVAEQVVAIEVVAERSTQQFGQVDLSAVLAGTRELSALNASLRWGGKTYRQSVDRKGQVRFIGLSLAALPSGLSELEIAFESVVENNDNDSPSELDQVVDEFLNKVFYP